MKKIISLVIAILILVGCSSKPSGPTIRIGTKAFTESLVVGELYALALEDAGYNVERKFNIAGSLIHASIINNEIDLYPEYTGTGLLSILKMDLVSDPKEVYDIVKKEYNEKFEITWLEQSNANDSQGLVIRTDVSNELGIKTISDLQAKSNEIRFTSQGDFEQREDGIPGLEKLYGKFNFKSITLYDNGLKYQILENDEGDVAPAYTTEGQLVNKDKFTVLVDDKQFWPPYYLTPIVRNEVLQANPEIEEIINNITSKLDTDTVINLNAKVDVDKLEYEEVAKEFYDSIK